MVRAAQTFHAIDPDTRRRVVFRGPGKYDGEVREQGDEVPLSVALRVGDHVLDWEGEERPEAPDVDVSEFDVDAFDQAVAAKVAAEVEQAVAAAVEQAVIEVRDAEAAAFAALTDAEDEFDPDADGVNADTVRKYLEGLDRDTAAGAYEYDRVVAAEQAGKNRSTAIPS